MEMMVASGELTTVTPNSPRVVTRAKRTYGSNSSRPSASASFPSLLQPLSSSLLAPSSSYPSISARPPPSKPTGELSVEPRPQRQSERRQVQAALKASLSNGHSSSEARPQRKDGAYTAPRRPNRDAGRGKARGFLSSDSDLSEEDALPRAPLKASRRSSLSPSTLPGHDPDEDDAEIPDLVDVSLPGPSRRHQTPPSFRYAERSNRNDPIRVSSSSLSPSTPSKMPSSRLAPGSGAGPEQLTPSKRSHSGRKLAPYVEILTKSPSKSHVSDSSPLSSPPRSSTRAQKTHARRNYSSPSKLAGSSDLSSDPDEPRRSPRKRGKVDYTKRTDIGEAGLLWKDEGETSADPLNVIDQSSTESDLSDAPEELFPSLTNVSVESTPSKRKRKDTVRETPRNAEEEVKFAKRETAAARIRREGAKTMKDIKRQQPARPLPPRGSTSKSPLLSPSSSELTPDSEASDVSADEGEGEESEADEADEEDPGDDFVPTSSKKARSKAPPKAPKPTKSKKRATRKSKPRESSPALSEDGLRRMLAEREQKEAQKTEKAAAKKRKQQADADALFWEQQADMQAEERDAEWHSQTFAHHTRTQEEYAARSEIFDPALYAGDNFDLLKGGVARFHEEAKAALDEEDAIPLEHEDHNGEPCRICGEKTANDRFPGMFRWMIRMYDAQKRGKKLEEFSEYCRTHSAESRGLFRHGAALGYPQTIDFVDLPRRLETPWIRSELRKIARNPRELPTYQLAYEDLSERGPAWRKLAYQRSAPALRNMAVGYYGDVGQQTILDHINRMDRRELFPTLHPEDDSMDPTSYPFKLDEFKKHVLVPEAAVLLIMEDRGWTGGSAPEFAEAREQARGVREKSRDFGKYAWFEVDGDDVKRTILERGPPGGVSDAPQRKKKTMTAGSVSTSKEQAEPAPPFGPSPSSSPPLPPSAQPNGHAKRSHKSVVPPNGSSTSQLSSSSIDTHARLDSPQSSIPPPQTAITPSQGATGRPRRMLSQSSLPRSQSFDELAELGEEAWAVADEVEKASVRVHKRK